MIQIAVFVDTPDRYTRSGELVPMMTYIGGLEGSTAYAYALAQAIDLAKWYKRRYSKVWIGKGSW